MNLREILKVSIILSVLVSAPAAAATGADTIYSIHGARPTTHISHPTHARKPTVKRPPHPRPVSHTVRRPLHPTSGRREARPGPILPAKRPRRFAVPVPISHPRVPIKPVRRSPPAFLPPPAPHPAPQPLIDLTQDLVAWWTGDGSPVDRIGGNNGTLIGDVGYASTGHGRGFFFNGKNGLVHIPDSDALKLTGSMTIAARVEILEPVFNGGQIFFRGDDRGGLDPYMLEIFVRPDGQPVLRFWIEDAANQGAGVTDVLVPAGQFIRLAATLDGESGLMRVYVDGKLAGQNTTVTRPLGDLDPTQKPGIAIGNTQDPSVYNEPFHGIVSDVRVYRRALSLEEVAALAAVN